MISDPASSLTLTPKFAVVPDFCDNGRSPNYPADCGVTCDPIDYVENSIDPNSPQVVTVGPTNDIGPSDPNGT